LVRTKVTVPNAYPRGTWASWRQMAAEGHG